MPLSSALEGYRASERDIAQRNDEQLKSSMGQMGLLAQLQAQQQAAAVKAALASGNMEALTRLPGGVAIAGQLAQLQEHQAKLAQAQRAEAFRKRLPEFMTPAVPEQQPVTPVDDNGNPNPVVAGAPAKMDLQGLLRASVAAGLQDPIAYAKEQFTENKPLYAPRQSPGYWQAGEYHPTPQTPAPKKPMVEHRYPIGDDMVQPHLSFDNGVTWTPVEGSQPQHAFGKQVAPTFVLPSNVQTHTDKDGNLWERAKGGEWKRAIGFDQTQTPGAVPEGGVALTSRMPGKDKPLSTIAKLNEDLKAERITPEQHKAAMAKATGDGGVPLTDEAIDQGAARYNIDGTLPPNLGRGTQGATNTARVLNKAADLAKEAGDTGEEARVRQIAGRAGQMALGQLTKQKNLILAFENTAGRNADLALQQSDITDRPTEKPAIDRWLQAGKKQLQGDVAVAKLDLAVKSFANEYARVVTTVTGGGVTTDNARAEITNMINSAQTKEQLREVISLAKQEMANRRKGYEQQEAEIKNGFKRPAKAGAVDANSFFKP